MSLIRFLTATRSINGSHDKPTPYRLPEQNLLPKFGSPARGRTRAQEDLKKQDGKVAPLPVAAVSGASGTRPTNAGSEMNLSATAQTKTRAMEGKRTWMFWRNWFAPKPQKPAAAVQVELELDEVKVVRNDLSDADLEVLTKTAKKAKAEVVEI